MKDHFEKNNIDRFGSRNLLFKSALMIMLFLIPIIIISSGIIENPFAVICLYIISGLGMAGIGMGIMHDANHGSYSDKKWLNGLMSSTIYLVGASKDIWKIQHNVLHHSFTNIDGYDEDINPPKILRFSPNQKKIKWHRYQHLYAWFFYGLTTLSWSTSKDFFQLNQFSKDGLINNRKTYFSILTKMILSKICFFTIVLLFPLLFSGINTWIIILAFLLMQFITGLIITLVFQAAHVVPNTKFPSPNNDRKITTDRMSHQLLTTSNFSQNSKLLFWLFGGLTNQIEHHLFPNICHVHYRKLAPIVKATAIEFGLPYHVNGSFSSVINQHFRFLQQLGR